MDWGASAAASRPAATETTCSMVRWPPSSEIISHDGSREWTGMNVSVGLRFRYVQLRAFSPLFGRTSMDSGASAPGRHGDDLFDGQVAAAIERDHISDGSRECTRMHA